MTTKTPAVQAGDKLTWTHYPEPGQGEPSQRTGTVWSQAPTGNGLSNAWWVFPDSPQPGEVTAGGVVAVGRNSRGRYGAGSYETWGGFNGPDKGETYGSGYWKTQPGSLTQAAASQAAAARTQREAEVRAMCVGPATAKAMLATAA
jgi:hypothetical protein